MSLPFPDVLALKLVSYIPGKVNLFFDWNYHNLILFKNFFSISHIGIVESNRQRKKILTKTKQIGQNKKPKSLKTSATPGSIL